MHLGKIIQGPKEALRSFVKRFNLEALQIQDLNDGVTFDAFIRGLRSKSIKFDLVKKKITTLAEALREAEAFIHANEVCAKAKHPKTKKVEEAIQPKKTPPKRSRHGSLTSTTTSSRRSKKKSKKLRQSPQPSVRINTPFLSRLKISMSLRPGQL